MRSETKDKQWYFDDPRMRRWMVQCVVCQAVGYRHDSPEEFFGRQRIVHNFRPLEVDDAGVCTECQRAHEVT